MPKETELRVPEVSYWEIVRDGERRVELLSNRLMAPEWFQKQDRIDAMASHIQACHREIERRGGIIPEGYPAAIAASRS